MNEQSAKESIKTAYRTIRIVKEIQRGNRSCGSIAKKCNCSIQLADWYLKKLTRSKLI